MNRLGSPGAAARGGEEGFSLIEVVVALGLAAFAFAALASAMAGGMRALAVEKTRVRANAIATDAIEDLQRLSYDGLGVCVAASTTPPDGLGSAVTLPNCPSAATTSTYGQQPCNTATAGVQVPASRYTCVRSNITYTVTRYVAWADAGQTIKRLAVFVNWTDTVGNHEVTQQSSIRSPSVASVIGLSAPTLSSPVVSPGTVTLTNGNPTGNVSLTVTASGLSTTDRVIATFSSLASDGQPERSSVSLSSTSGSLWTGQITPAFTFGTGTQFLSFAAVRASDGKANSVTSDVVKFCPSSDPTCSSTLTLPSFTTTSVPATASIDSSGALTATVSVSVVTRNVTLDDSVSFAFQTLSGAVSVFMEPDSVLPCSIAACTWRGTIPASAGYAFAKGSQRFSFTAEQIVNPDALSVDKGSTVAASSSSISFS